MKILWVKADFLHPTTKGGHIRTLEILRRLHRRHEIHYIGLAEPTAMEGPRRSGEYSTRAYPVPHRLAGKDSAAFLVQAAAGLFSTVPVAVSRYRSEPMARQIEELRAAEQDYPPGWIEEAIRLAVERNARNWRYIRRVLERWQAEGKDRGLTKRPTQADRYRYIQGEYSDTVDY